jgi:AraC-like DNA-binding protein
MKTPQDIYFHDKSFPLLMRPESRSAINEVGITIQAIHEAIEIKYFYEGTSTLLIGNDTVNVTAGDVIVINPYEFHATLDNGGENTGRYHLFMIGLNFFEGVRAAGIDLRHLIYGKNTTFKTKFSNNALLNELLSRAVNEHESDTAASRLALFGIFAEVFAELLKHGKESSEGRSNEDILHYYNVIETAIRMIRDEYSRRFTVEMLAEACNISKFHFCRIFKSVMGMSAIKYLNVYRLKIADTLLTSSDRQIGEISAICGFEDAGYFARIYKEQYGHTPSKREDAK